MVSTAAGSVSLAQQHFVTMLGDSTNFRTFVGASGANIQAQALARIYQDALPPSADGREFTLIELQELRPYALVWTAPGEGGFTISIDGVGNNNEFAESGTLMLRLARDVPDDIVNQPAEIVRTFQNIYGQILDDLITLTVTAGNLSFNRIDLVDGQNVYEHAKEEGQGFSQDVEFAISWGNE